ncbi:hypothetical protein ACLOJK_021750 [Asimina triloba]
MCLSGILVLLKLIHDHKDDDGRQPGRVSGMISILDGVKARIEQSQTPPTPTPTNKAQFRRCNTELRRATASKKPQEPAAEENQRLRREASENKTTRKNLERMFSSLGKEKEIMEAELAHKARRLNEMAEELDDLKIQNERLTEKINACAAHHKERKEERVVEREVTAAFQERNQLLSVQLLRSLEGYRNMKRKSKQVQDENEKIRSQMVDIAKQVEVGLDRIHDLKRRVRRSQDPMDVEHELSNMERMFRCFGDKIAVGMQPTRSLCV